MKLIDIASNETVAELTEDSIHFSSPMMEEDMEINGIAIPQYLQEIYNDQFLVFLDDPLFPQAFREVYYEYQMNHDKYKWVE